MTTEEKSGLVASVAVVFVALVALVSLNIATKQAILSMPKVQAPTQAQFVGTDLTVNPQTGYYTDLADLNQNVQAMAERMTSNTVGTILQTDANGRMQVVSPDSVTGTWSINIVKTGNRSTFTVTGTAALTDVCDSSLWEVTPVTTTPTITIPASTTLFAGCLSENYSERSFLVKAIGTSTILAVGTGGNIDPDATTTIAADKSARVYVMRDSDSTYQLTIDNYNN